MIIGQHVGCLVGGVLREEAYQYCARFLENMGRGAWRAMHVLLHPGGVMMPPNGAPTFDTTPVRLTQLFHATRDLRHRRKSEPVSFITKQTVR